MSQHHKGVPAAAGLQSAQLDAIRLNNTLNDVSRHR
jgi:hypothetical protein